MYNAERAYAHFTKITGWKMPNIDASQALGARKQTSQLLRTGLLDAA